MAKAKASISLAERGSLRAIGARIKGLREAAGLTVYDVSGADMPVKDRQHWQRIEAGKNINLTTLLRVAKSLKVTASEILKNI